MERIVPLNDGNKMPTLAYGAGTALLKRNVNNISSTDDTIDRQTVELLKTALRVGYRHLDVAEKYNTEREVGVAIKEMKDEVPRSELFVTTKVSSDFLDARRKIDVSLEKLGLEYVDLYLIHTPYWAKSPTDLQKAWSAMEDIKISGKARSIGVSNYSMEHLQTTLATARIPPAINQIEYHPYIAKNYEDTVAFSKTNGIKTCAFGALEPMTRNIPGPLDETLKNLAEKYGVSEGVICLWWCLRQGVVPVTTSRKEERMKEYLVDAFRGSLTEEEVQAVLEKAVESLKGQEVVFRIQRHIQRKEKEKRELSVAS